MQAAEITSDQTSGCMSTTTASRRWARRRAGADAIDADRIRNEPVVDEHEISRPVRARSDQFAAGCSKPWRVRFADLRVPNGRVQPLGELLGEVRVDDLGAEEGASLSGRAKAEEQRRRG
jgi:hypothetical protein